MAKFLACMLVTEELPARRAKCLIRYSTVLENNTGSVQHQGARRAALHKANLNSCWFLLLLLSLKTK